jgi:predicted RNA-binding Zn ribbon-like protein
MTDWIRDGGRDCIDFLNTLRDRKTGPRELLDSPARLAEWLGMAEQPTPAQLVAARDLREAIDRALVGGDPDIALLNRWSRAAHRPPVEARVGEDGQLYAWRRPPADPVRAALGALAADAIDLLTTRPAPRITVCGSSRCGLRFVDSSPAGNRQWCSMRRCGNREKARRNYLQRQSVSVDEVDESER